MFERSGSWQCLVPGLLLFACAETANRRGAFELEAQPYPSVHEGARDSDAADHRAAKLTPGAQSTQATSPLGVASNATAPSAELSTAAVPSTATELSAAVSSTAVPSEVTSLPVEAPCSEVSEIREQPPKEEFSANGYAARTLTVQRVVDGVEQRQCVTVAWPRGKENLAGQPSRVAKHIDDAWFRLLENTLRRVPYHHATTVHRFVIDNRPTRHGIAAFDRQDLLDGRDGHTIWLNEHLFLHPNHWERGVRGDYFAYHTNVDGAVINDAAPDHALFSPVLLHELGHLVMYHLVNPARDPISTPACARTCSDDDTCAAISKSERERACISPYCRPFKYKGSTENWAEQYRFYYQSSTTRSLLLDAAQRSANCVNVLEHHDGLGGAPWERGLPDLLEFHPSRWDSCGGTACKPW